MATIGWGHAKGAGPAAAGLKGHRKRQHLEALPLEQSLGAGHVEGTGDQQDAGTSAAGIPSRRASLVARAFGG